MVPSQIKPLVRRPNPRVTPADLDRTQLPQARSLPPRPAHHITYPLAGAATSVVVGAGGDLVGLSPTTAIGTATIVGVGSVGGAIAGARRARRRELLDTFIERSYVHLGASEPSRRMVSRVRWSKGWPGTPTRLRVHFTSAARLNDGEWETELRTLINDHEWGGTYRVVNRSLNRHWIEWVLEPQTAAPEVEAEAVQRARRYVEQLLGPTCHITAISTDPSTGEVRTIEGRHEISHKLAPSGYRARLERAVSSTFPGRWRAHFDLERDTFRFEQRPSFPDHVLFLPTRPLSDVDYRSVEIPYAIDEDGKVLVWRPWRDPHFLVTGSTGSGKTSTSHGILSTFAMYEWPVWVADGKGIEFLSFRSWPNVQVVASTTPEHVSVLTRARELMEYRYNLIVQGKARTEDFTPLLVVVDEYADMRANILEWYSTIKVKGDPTKPPVLNNVSSIARKGRTARVHLLVSLQRPDVELLGSGEMRENLQQRYSLGYLSPKAAEMMWGSSTIGTTIPRGLRGRGTAYDTDRQRYVEAQSYFTPDPGGVIAGTPEAGLVEAIRPVDSAHERMLIREPKVAADLDDESGDEMLPTYSDYLAADWVPAVDYPELDPLRRDPGRYSDPALYASPTALFTSALRSPRREQIEVGSEEALPQPAASAADDASADRGRELLAVAGRRALHVVPDVDPPWDTGADDDEVADEWDEHSREPLSLVPSDIEVGDLVLVDDDQWALVCGEPGEDLIDPDMFAIPWRVGDEEAEMLVSPDDAVSVRKPSS